MSVSRPPARVLRSRKDARASYDKLSRWYDLLAWGSESKPTLAGVRMLHVQEGELVLEIGFGTGHALVILAREAGLTGRVWGIDLSPGMAEVSKRRINRAGLADRVDVQVGDATALPFARDTFDAVFMGFTLELFDTPEIPRVLNECWRVLRHGGRVGVVSMALTEESNLMMRLYEWSHRTFPKWVDCRPIPVVDMLQQNRFLIAGQTSLSMWGLPVAIVVGKKQDA
jgi:ubiquinone/menaquinone biosynthesis C-methylase UbiE